MSISGTKWKEIVSDLVEKHGEDPLAIVFIKQPDALMDDDYVVLIRTPDRLLYEEEGETLTPRHVRGWLWEQRSSRAPERKGSALISRVWEGKSYVAIANVVPRRLYERYTELIKEAP